MHFLTSAPRAALSSRFRTRTISRPTSWALSIAILLGVLAPSRDAHALHPKSPEVRAAIDKAMAYLEQPYNKEDPNRDHVGLKAVVGLVFVKEDRKDHARVKEALAAIKAEIAGGFPDFRRHAHVYGSGLCLTFLVEHDAEGNRAEIEAMMNYILALQKSNGAWGYNGKEEGDTSMTQFSALSLWLADAYGYPVSADVWTRMCNWVLRTQDPSGAWGYQGKDSAGGSLIAQAEIRPSMVVAGLGILCLSSEHLGVLQFHEDGSSDERFKPVADADKKGKDRIGGVDEGKVTTALTKGDGYFNANFTVKPEFWPHYYLYAMERYQSIRERTIGTVEKEPKWYTEGAQYLIDAQKPDGHWVSFPGVHHATDTCFSILFLIRSFYKSIAKAKGYGGGTQTGNRGLPLSGDIDDTGGKVRARPLTGPASDLIKLIEDPSNPDFAAAAEGLTNLVLESEEDLKKLNSVQQRLRDLVKGGQPAQREIAVRALAKSRSLDDVPVLIEALKDPDGGVARAADEGLRFISRKLDGVVDFTDFEKEIVDQAIAKWQAWYVSIRPDIEIEE